MKRLSTVVAIVAAFLLLYTGLAHAAPAQVTEFPFTESVYNTCNDDLVLLNGTLVDSVTVATDRNGGLRYDHRMWWKDVRAESTIGVTYTVTKVSVDTFSTRLRNGTETVRSLQASWLHLKPVNGGTGELRVAVIYAFATNAQGITRTFDRYVSTCR